MTARIVNTAAAILAMTGLAGTASAQPDVYWGNCTAAGITQYGPVGGVRAFSFETYTCNKGGSSLLWVNAATPGIAFNGFRLHNGRMVQIGLGNAKTACCVANTTDTPNCGNIGTCQAGPSGLRVGCRDFYSAGYNAGQSKLSPRSGINAFTGTFGAIPSATFNAIDRRLQIAESAMNSTTYPGAQYIMEGVYVATDEVGAAKLNNCSYMRVNISPTYAMSLVAGSFVREEPAIKAWRLHGNGPGQGDTRVEDGHVDVPGEGRFLYAHKVTDLGNGQWLYDYAVYNMTSHRSAGGLRIPVPAGVTVSDIGFHDVHYHSGEPFSGTDWPGSKVGDEVVWQTESFAANPNANAIRWGTMYNFWFTADQPPVVGDATLELFRTGTPGSITFPVRVPQTGTPPCNVDFNGVDGVTVQDIYDFLAQWSAQNPATDYNGVDGITVQDIYDFLTDWNAGCP